MMNENRFTPPHVPVEEGLVDITPVGDHDKKPKVQLCLEIRKKEVPSTRKSKNNKRVEQMVLEVTVMWVKHLPLSRNPFVKLKLQDNMQTTELSSNSGHDAQYIEVFTFQLKSKEDLTESMLEVQVCDKKATRNATQFGHVSIPLTNLKLGKPICEWHYLRGTDASGLNAKMSTLKIKKGMKKSNQTEIEDIDQDQEDPMKENVEISKVARISKSKRKLTSASATSVQNSF